MEYIMKKIVIISSLVAALTAGNTVQAMAAKHHEALKVKLLYKPGTNNDPLLDTISTGNSELVAQELAKPGVDSNAHRFNGSIDLVNVIEIDGEGATPLTIAACAGFHDIVTLLIAHGADINGQDVAFRETPLVWAIMGLDFLNLAKSSPLIESQKNNYLMIVKTLIAHGADVNLPDNDGTTPFMHAAKVGSVELMQLLIAAGADMQVRNVHGNTPLHAAVNNFSISLEVLRFLLEHGIAIDHQNTAGKTALICAAEDGNINALNQLWLFRPNVMLQDRYGMTACMYAAKRGLLSQIGLLVLLNGATIYQQDNNHQTALDIARHFHQDDVVNFLTQEMAARKPAIEALLPGNDIAGEDFPPDVAYGILMPIMRSQN